MTHSNIFSPNNHFRHSHYLQPETLAPPPSSFGRSGGFKTSLRKIPSALFANKEKTPIKKKPSKATLQIFADSPPRSMKLESTRVTQPPSVVGTGAPVTATEKDKGKTKKPRKALADLFGWGNHHHHNTQPQPPVSPQLTKPAPAPAVPAKDHPAMLKKIGRPPSTKSNNSHFSALRPPVEPAMAARTSMGDDPFVRDGQGAQVVDHVFRHVSESPSVRSIALDRRASITSSKALSMKTVMSDGQSTKEPTDRILPTVQSTTNQRHVSAPLPSPAPLADLPPRSASLGKLLGSSMGSAPLPEVPESPVEAEKEVKTLQREKTKSKVWGLLGRSKSKKAKTPSELEPPVPVPKDPWSWSAMPPSSGPSLSAQIDDKIAAATLRSNASSMRSKASRPRPPVLHISGPSMDDSSLKAPFTASTVSMPRTDDKPAFDDIDVPSQTTPSKYPMNSGRGGVWESVVGSMADRPSEDGARHAIEALMGPARLPKRKSLSGLFGLPIRKSMDKLKPSSPPRLPSISVHHRFESSPPRIAAQPTLRSLAEEAEASEPFISAIVPSDHFSSRFVHQEPSKEVEPPVRHDPGLRRVASATDKLFNLVTCLDFSPASTNSPTLHKMGSHSSLRQGFNGSPTPVRRIKSAMLSQKPSGSSLKPPSANVSPLKLALHRAQAVARHHPEVKPVSPPRESLVRKGMRNIFAPPSPRSPERDHPSHSANNSATKAANASVAAVSKPTMADKPARSVPRSIASDIPADLQALLDNITAKQPVSPLQERSTLGLPPVPPANRPTPRRAAVAPPAPPAVSLPPSPNVQLGKAQPSGLATSADESTGENNARDSAYSDKLSTGANDFRNSFDFTNEYAALDQGTQRASFVEALKKVSSVQMFMDTAVPPVPTLPASPSSAGVAPETIPSFHISKPSDSTAAEDDSETEDEDEGDYGDDEALEDTAEIHHVVGFAKTSPVRREPFKGQVAFQQHTFAVKQQPSHASFGAPEPADQVLAALPPVEQHRRRGHRRGESGLSIATMSSIGSVIGTGNEREYTNYFDVNFSNQHGHSRHQSITETIHEVSDEQSPQRIASRDSMSSVNTANQPMRPTTRRAHHRRNSSIVSVESLSDVLGHNFSVGPPVALRNANRRSGYISRHRRNSSVDSTFGRPDWAAHRRDSSVASTSSNFSVSQIARPGLGDRMFQLDGGVQLTSITGSPPDEVAQSARPSGHQRDVSWDSLFDASQTKVNDSLFDNSQMQRTFDSLFDSDGSVNRSSTDCDSLFGPERQSSGKSFFLRGLRPISTVSTATEASRNDDTFMHVQRYMEKVQTPVRKVERDFETCLQADGEDMSGMTPLGKAKKQVLTGRQMLGSSMSRPQKPGRRRPAQLILTEPPLDTPGLTSPSASETSSRLSLDTNAASFTLGVRARPHGAGHYRQKSSAGVQIDATIHEMPSMATLRAHKLSASPASRSNAGSREPTIVGVDGLDDAEEFDRMRSVRNWVEWEREAVDEFRKTTSYWRDSDESKHALEGWRMPSTTAEIAAFIAQSTQAYKPLDQLPIGRIAHRRKSSLSDSRALCSPYGLPLPKAEPVNKPKMSLTTKYQKKSSTSSTASSAASTFAFAFPDEAVDPPCAPPLSAVFAQFARETPPSPPPTLAPFKPASPFHLPALDEFGLRQQLEADCAGKAGDQKRSRVTSSARRQALGWGRRRHSDGPEKVVGMMGHLHAHGSGPEVSLRHDPLPAPPASAMPLQLKTVIATKNKQSEKSEKDSGSVKGKGKMNIFMGAEMGGRSTAHFVSGQENQMTSAAPKQGVKARSPVKKRGLRQAVSQPRTLRV